MRIKGCRLKTTPVHLKIIRFNFYKMKVVNEFKTIVKLKFTILKFPLFY